MNAHPITWMAATLIALVLSSGYLLDGPSEIEAAQTVSGDLQDAIKYVADNAVIERAERQFTNQTTVAMVRP